MRVAMFRDPAARGTLNWLDGLANLSNFSDNGCVGDSKSDVTKARGMSDKKSSAKPKVTFGIRVPNSGPLASPESIVKVAREAESLGYDSIWVHDHLTWTEEIHRTHISSGSDDSHRGNDSPDFYEAMTTLAYVAGLVRRVRLGIACLVVPCRNPLLAAKQISSLDVFCDGRLDIGLGIGSPSTLKSREYEVLGVNRKLRGKIADDHIRAMKTIWTTPACDLRRRVRRVQGRGDLSKAAAETASAPMDRRVDRGGDEKNGNSRRRLAAGLAFA